MRTLIVGGGAAGLSAAIAAAGRGDGVTVLERNRRPLKKLGVTGNGRGNLLNSGEPVFYGNREFALKVLSHMPYARVRAFLEDLGITLTREEERVYPAALMAGVARMRCSFVPKSWASRFASARVPCPPRLAAAGLRSARWKANTSRTGPRRAAR